MKKQSFIDLHCHLFNMVDVPVYETLDGKVRMNTLLKLVGAFSASGAFLSGLVRSKIGDYKDFIQFFERAQDANLLALASQIQRAVVQGTTVSETYEQVVLTPLVMDFDCIRQECGERCKPCTAVKNCPHTGMKLSSIATDPSAEAQYYRLRETIKRVEKTEEGEGGKLKVLPFIGFDLRKLTPQNSNALSELKKFWEKVGVTKTEREGGFSEISSGKALGIKLYPPIGFNPYPQDDVKAVVQYKKFYEWCIEERIPLTVHCQSGSYSATRRQRAINKDTHIKNWSALFVDWGKGNLRSEKDIKELRINFAHFGGENGLEDMLDWYGVDNDAWTYQIIQMMKEYPHVYSDISAFNWVDDGDAENFATVFKLNEKNELGRGDYRVQEKILWGSDVPMVISEDSYCQGKDESRVSDYGYLMNNFTKAVDLIYEENPQLGEQLIENMISKNPESFLLR